MKKVVLLLLIVALLLSGCESIEQAMHPGKSKIAGVWVDNANLSKYDFNGITAETNGDTYCYKCKKFTEGKVRICPHCGQYI